MTDDLPNDLVPLQRWAKRLGVDTPKLRSASEREEFPTIYRLFDGVYRVSDSAVTDWLKSCSVSRLAARGKLIRKMARSVDGRQRGALQARAGGHT